MNQIKENVDFVIIPAKNPDESYSVQILTGDYLGVRYRYGKVEVEEDTEKGEAYLNFSFDIVDVADKENLVETLEFKNHIGDILVAIISKTLPKEEESE